MITVVRYGNVNEALQLKMMLEAQGIAAFIPDEYAATNAPYRFLTGSEWRAGSSGRGRRRNRAEGDQRVGEN